MAVPDERIVAKIIFPVVDMTSAVAFYRGLGFEVEAYDHGYAWVRYRGGEVLHLALVEGLDPAANRAAGYFHVQDPDAWHAAFTAVGAELSPVADRPWAMREFELRDPSGNLLRVGANL